jgi:hypothetical protein
MPGTLTANLGTDKKVLFSFTSLRKGLLWGLRYFMEIGWILGGIFLFATLIFIAICFFLPEWVGITGKKAQQNMKEQQGDHKP